MKKTGLGSGHVEHHDEEREQDHGGKYAGEERGRALMGGTHGENATTAIKARL